MQQEQRLVARGAADVHVLAEDGELLGQVAVQRRHLLEARLGEDAAARDQCWNGWVPPPHTPTLRRVAGRHQRVADLAQLRQQAVVAGLHVGRHLDHAFGDLGHHVAGKAAPRQQVQHVGAGVDQVEVAQADQLQFQLDADRQRFRGFEGFQRHIRISPAGGFRRQDAAPAGSRSGPSSSSSSVAAASGAR